MTLNFYGHPKVLPINGAPPTIFLARMKPQMLNNYWTTKHSSFDVWDHKLMKETIPTQYDKNTHLWNIMDMSLIFHF